MENSMEEKQSPYKEFEEFLKNFSDGYTYINQQKTVIAKKKMQEIYITFAQHSKKGNDDRKFEEVIEELRKEKNKSFQEDFDIINHAVWLWCLPNNRKSDWTYFKVADKKNLNKSNQKDIINENKNRYKDGLLKLNGVAGGGSGYVQTKTNGVRFVLFLFTQLVSSANLDLKQKIEEACKRDKYDDKYEVPDGVKNLLLHLCYSKKYEPIASSADKVKIVKAFEDFIGFNATDAGTDVDTKIKKIRDYLEGKEALSKGASFYNNSLPLMWKGESATDLSLLQKLEYKKAMILYGPPGTGKTYTAMELAKEMIVRHFMKQYKEAKRLADKNKKDHKKKEDAKKALNKCFEILRNIGEEKKKYISYLQFHINYNYEDFIAGQVINGKSIETKPGFIFDVINKARKHSDIPYVVILDEINRTDISRVFGELFTAIEKRGEDVTLTFPKPPEEEKAEVGKQEEKERLVLNLPENIYFIGTMNEIDFSLERVDFALRRRFIWELHDYSEDALESIINYRLKHYPYEEWFRYYKRQGKTPEEAKELAKSCLGNSKKVVTDSEIDSEKNFVEQRIKTFQGVVNEVYNKYLDGFCISCTNLNKKVAEAMGEEYHIGHAFFAEIANLYIELIQNAVNKPWNTAKKVLWEISIKPTLEAYCGTMDKTEKEKYLKGQGGKFYEAFFGKENPEDD